MDVLLRLSGVGVGKGEQGRASHSMASLRIGEAWFREKEGGKLEGHASLRFS